MQWGKCPHVHKTHSEQRGPSWPDICWAGERKHGHRSTALGFGKQSSNSFALQPLCSRPGLVILPLLQCIFTLHLWILAFLWPLWKYLQCSCLSGLNWIPSASSQDSKEIPHPVSWNISLWLRADSQAWILVSVIVWVRLWGALGHHDERWERITTVSHTCVCSYSDSDPKIRANSD